MFVSGIWYNFYISHCWFILIPFVSVFGYVVYGGNERTKLFNSQEAEVAA